MRSRPSSVRARPCGCCRRAASPMPSSCPKSNRPVPTSVRTLPSAPASAARIALDSASANQHGAAVRRQPHGLCEQRVGQRAVHEILAAAADVRAGRAARRVDGPELVRARHRDVQRRRSVGHRVGDVPRRRHGAGRTIGTRAHPCAGARDRLHAARREVDRADGVVAGVGDEQRAVVRALAEAQALRPLERRDLRGAVGACGERRPCGSRRGEAVDRRRRDPASDDPLDVEPRARRVEPSDEHAMPRAVRDREASRAACIRRGDGDLARIAERAVVERR